METMHVNVPFSGWCVHGNPVRQTWNIFSQCHLCIIVLICKAFQPTHGRIHNRNKSSLSLAFFMAWLLQGRPDFTVLRVNLTGRQLSSVKAYLFLSCYFMMCIFLRLQTWNFLSATLSLKKVQVKVSITFCIDKPCGTTVYAPYRPKTRLQLLVTINEFNFAFTMGWNR